MTPTHNLNVYNDGGSTSMTVGKYAAGKTVGLITTSADTNGYFSIQSYKSQGTTLGNIVLNGAGGNVGIGTNAPAHKFHVNGISTTDNEPVVWLHNGHNAANKDGTVISTANDGDDAEVLHVRTNNTTYNGGTSLMLVRGDGNVGIGIDVPLSQLHVKDTYSANYSANGEPSRHGITILNNADTGTYATPHAGILFMSGSSGTGRTSVGGVRSGDGLADLVFGSGTVGGSVTERMRIASAGAVGIGTSSPVAQGLTVANIGDVNLTLLADSNADGADNWPVVDFRVDNVSGNLKPEYIISNLQLH